MAKGGTSTRNATAAKNRSYSIFDTLTIKPGETGTKAMLDALQKKYGDGPHEILIRVAREDAEQPDQALAAVTERRDLKGDFGVMADSALKVYPTEVEVTKKAKVGKPKK